MERLLLIHKSLKSFLVDKNKDFHSHLGSIKKDILINARPGDILKTTKGEELYVLEPFFYDLYSRIERKAQIIPIKDLGIILSTTLVSKEDIVVDAGTGSAALAIFLARYVKKVISYDIRKDHLEIGKRNAKLLNVKNIEFKFGNIYNPNEIEEKNVSLLTLDVPEPWKALDTAKKILKLGGFLVAYTPTIIQNSDFVNSLTNDFIHIKTVNILEMEWEIKNRVIRPKTRGMFHSGFLSFVRLIHK